MEFTGNSVVYNPTFNDESQDASGACAYFPMHYVNKTNETFLSPKTTKRFLLQDHRDHSIACIDRCDLYQ